MEEKSLREEIRELKEVVSAGKIKKPKKFKLPTKAKVSNNKLKKGYITIAVINDNMSLDFQKQEIIDGTVKLDDTFHAVEDFDVFSYKGKPFIFQAKSKLNPYNPVKNPLEGDNETYGQKYVMARMEGDKITAKKRIGGWGLTIGGLIIGGIILYALITGGGA